MKKGYEIQKIAVLILKIIQSYNCLQVINHLDRYLNEAGANEELLAVIVVRNINTRINL